MPAPSAPAEGTSPPRTWLAMVPLLLGILVGSLSISATTTALPAIAADLGLDGATGLWIVDAYPLALAVSLVVVARLGDAVGRRRVLVAGLAGFTVLSVAGGLAPTGAVLVAVRAGMGVCGATVLASTVAIIGVTFLPRERVVAYGLWTMAFGTGSTLGPVVGGLVVDVVGWPWILFGCAPIAALAVILAPFLVPESRAPSPPHWDAVSIVASVLALGGIVFALQHLGLEPVAAAVAGAVGIVALAVFVRRQLRADEPFLDLRPFAVPGFRHAFVRIVVAVGANAASAFLVSLHLQQVRGATATEAGLAILPQAAAVVLGGLAVPVIRRWASGPAILTAALAVQAAGLVWTATELGPPGAPLALVGLGVGAAGTVGAAQLFDSSTPDLAGTVGAIQEIAFALGSGLGIAAFGSIASFGGDAGFAIALGTAAAVSIAAAVLPAVDRGRAADTGTSGPQPADGDPGTATGGPAPGR